MRQIQQLLDRVAAERQRRIFRLARELKQWPRLTSPREVQEQENLRRLWAEMQVGGKPDLQPALREILGEETYNGILALRSSLTPSNDPLATSPSPKLETASKSVSELSGPIYPSTFKSKRKRNGYYVNSEDCLFTVSEAHSLFRRMRYEDDSRYSSLDIQSAGRSHVSNKLSLVTDEGVERLKRSHIKFLVSL